MSDIRAESPKTVDAEVSEVSYSQNQQGGAPFAAHHHQYEIKQFTPLWLVGLDQASGVCSNDVYKKNGCRCVRICVCV